MTLVGMLDDDYVVEHEGRSFLFDSFRVVWVGGWTAKVFPKTPRPVTSSWTGAQQTPSGGTLTCVAGNINYEYDSLDSGNQISQISHASSGRVGKLSSTEASYANDLENAGQSVIGFRRFNSGTVTITSGQSLQIHKNKLAATLFSGDPGTSTGVTNIATTTELDTTHTVSRSGASHETNQNFKIRVFIGTGDGKNVCTALGNWAVSTGFTEYLTGDPNIQFIQTLSPGTLPQFETLIAKLENIGTDITSQIDDNGAWAPGVDTDMDWMMEITTSGVIATFDSYLPTMSNGVYEFGQMQMIKYLSRRPSDTGFAGRISNVFQYGESGGDGSFPADFIT